MWLPRLRYTFARRPFLYWLVVGLAALLVAVRVHTADVVAQRSAAAWGTSRLAWVSRTTAEPGNAIDAVQRRYPVALLPTGTLGSLPAHARAARYLEPGQLLLTGDVAGARTPPAAWVVLAVPVEHAPRLVAGDAVAVMHSGVRVCDGIVVGGDNARAEAAMPVDCAATVSADIATVVLARRSIAAYGSRDDRP